MVVTHGKSIEKLRPLLILVLLNELLRALNQVSIRKVKIVLVHRVLITD